MNLEHSIVGKTPKQILHTLLDKKIVDTEINGNQNHTALLLKLDEGTEIIIISEIKNKETK